MGNYESLNREALPAHLAAELDSARFDREQLETFTSRDGAITARVSKEEGGSLLLHSRRAPEDAAQRFARNLELENISVVCQIGLGMGYYAEAIQRLLQPQQEFIIVITRGDIFQAALENRDLRGLLSDNRITWVYHYDNDTFIDAFQRTVLRLPGDDTELVIPPQFLQLIPQQCGSIKDLLEATRVFFHDAKRVSPEIRRNVDMNWRRIHESVPVSHFKNVFADLPICVVGAGPSLNRDLSELTRFAEKGIVVAVDAATPALSAAKVPFDFVVSTDPAEDVYHKFFPYFRTSDVPLVYSIGSHRQIIQEYQGDKIVSFPYKRQLPDDLDAVYAQGRLEAGATVTLTALDFAYYTGGKPIILVGQDLAVGADGQTHADNIPQREPHRDKTLLRTVEGVNGDLVYTTKGFYIHLREIENYIYRHQDREFLNASHGAFIQGTQGVSLGNLVESLATLEGDKKACLRRLCQHQEENGSH